MRTTTWRHLDTMQFKTMLHAKPPRVDCQEHGIKQASLLWAGKNSRFTLLYERLAIDVLLATQTVKAVEASLGTIWDETLHIQGRAVARGQACKTIKSSPIPRIGIDEKAFHKGQSCVTLLYDLDRSTVEAFSYGNDTAGGNACFPQPSKLQIDSIEAIAMDMAAVFGKSIRENIPLVETKIACDRILIIQMASDAVDKVRRADHKALKSSGDNTLTVTRFVWLTASGRPSEHKQERFTAVIDSGLKTGKAWDYKEMLREL